ncbi:MAG TPA: hypothetical protein VEA80_08125 [Vitreimonas sp.]|uniref:hypothetical protein n=1 Tax=Vitreimonas sp. TaxID=3069702 RepID=UPI002D6FF308|nr:hypothetical protein [Vitreimonas sp.]HYD87426.1 hypothetical protein [Vitreimonas sp.]
MRALIASAFMLATAAGAAQAQTQPAENDDLVITGSRFREMVRSFVQEVAPPELSEEQLARWNSRYCPLMAGIPARQAQYLVDRMSQRAHQLGLRPGDENCRPNVLVFITPDADVLAQALADDHDLVAYYNNAEYGNSLGRDALAAFVSSDAPVRWWHVAQTVTERGTIISNSGEVVRSEASRLYRPTRQDFNRVLVIVDARQAAGLQFEALGDYLAMVTLAQLDASADTSQIPSILNLFGQRGASEPRLTDWDLAYLEGLYSAPRHAPDSNAQERAITREMEDRLREPQ